MKIKIILGWVMIFVMSYQISCKSNKDHNSTNVQKIIVFPHETAAQVALKLKDYSIISNTKTFLFWARILRYDKKIKSGRYKFRPNTRTLDVLKTLSQGGENKALITIPEGFSIKQIAQILEAEGICSKQAFIKACSDKTLLGSLNVHSSNIEGYLFPDSYDFTISLEANVIIERMAKRFWQILSEIENSKIKNQKYLDTILIIASLVEKEAKLDNEREIIASVFYNRLKYAMPLQSCATVQYILPNHKEVLSVEDTKIESPYNSYLHPGLPPTPICNPGKASLQAAIRPAQTNYLYFAASKNGSHYFSKTFSEHQNFIRNKK